LDCERARTAAWYAKYSVPYNIVRRSATLGMCSIREASQSGGMTDAQYADAMQMIHDDPLFGDANIERTERMGQAHREVS
jgi:hypothetical protein